jgi:TrmH family RNA methyltransferase
MGSESGSREVGKSASASRHPHSTHGAQPSALITSTHNPTIVEIRSLHRRKGRKAQGAFLVEGPRAVAEALTTGAPIRTLILCPEMAGADALGESGDRRVPILSVNDAVMNSLADTETPQGVIAVVDLPGPVLPTLDRRRSLVLVVDGVRDPGNVGTLIRTAAAAGCAAIVTTAGTADAFSPKVVRAAMGMHFHVPVVADVSWDWLGPALAVLPAIYGTEMAAAVAYDAVDWNIGAALVIGHEDHGLSAEARAWCRTTVAIPMAPGVESLNAAVSGAVILFEAVRRRRTAT